MLERAPLLVAVTDLDRPHQEPEIWAAALFDGGVDIIQVRSRTLPLDGIRRVAQRVIGVAPSPEHLQINTHASIATELGCGIHLPERAGTERPALSPVSRSVHGAEAARASSEFDFVIAGHVFATPSKPGQEPRGTDWLAEVVSASAVPVVAIGGITAGNAAEVIRAGASGVAVIGALAGARDPSAAARELRRSIDRAWKDLHVQRHSTDIEVTLNGKATVITNGTTILDLLNEKELAERLVVVELNGTIVPRSLFAETRFSAGDQVEIVHFVGGGSCVDW